MFLLVLLEGKQLKVLSYVMRYPHSIVFYRTSGMKVLFLSSIIVRFYHVSFHRMMHVDSEMAHASIILPPNHAQKTKLFCNF